MTRIQSKERTNEDEQKGAKASPPPPVLHVNAPASILPTILPKAI